MNVLVAGIGNIFLGDDAFGVEVVRRLATRELPEGVQVADFGIRGFDLAHALMDADSTAVLVDATPRGGEPGTLYLIEASVDAGAPAIEPHGMDPASVLRLVHALGGRLPRVLLVGCEPSTLGFDEDFGQMGLSPPVEAAVDEAVRMIESLVADLQAETPAASAGPPGTIVGTPSGGETCLKNGSQGGIS
jgi:hydrogenase maturation protease